MKRALIAVGGFPILAEVAETEDEQRRGLMGRTRLADGHGMLFLYPGTSDRSFWMRDTLIPLDLLYAEKGVINAVHQLKPKDETAVAGIGDLALEMPAGWCEAHGVGPGHRIRLVMTFGEVGNG